MSDPVATKNPAPQAETAPQDPSPAPPRTKVSVGEWSLLVGSLVLFAVTVLLQLWATGSAGALVGLWLLASYSLLHTGGFTISDASFQLATQVGAGVAVLSVLGAVGRWAVGRWRRTDVRQRVIGPGGRVMRVFYTTKQEPVQHPLLSWVPDAWMLFLLYLLVVRGLQWDGNRWIPAVIPCALILANLYLFSLYSVWWLGRLWTGLWLWLLRFARGSGFRAGAVTMLVVGLVSWTIWADVRARADVMARDKLSEDQDERDAVRRQLSAAPTKYALQHELLFVTAEELWPERAFVAGLEHFLEPLFAAVHGPYWAGASLSADRPLLAMLGQGIATPDDEDSEKLFRDCVTDLYPKETSSAERAIVRQYHQLKRADGYDLVLEALLNVCQTHSTKTRYEKLIPAFWRAAKNAANKRVDPNRKYRREVSVSALGAPGADCDAEEPDRSAVRCPTARDGSVQRLEALETLAEINWLELTRVQCTVIFQKVLLRMSDAEIAASHAGMNPDQAKNTYQNARKKLRDGMTNTCRPSRDFSLPELRQRVPAELWPDDFGLAPR